MQIDLSQFRQTFLQESADHVSTMETGLLDLRSAPTDIELLNSIFRSAHSIKGGAGSFGLTNLVRFTHTLENLLDQLRSEQVRVTDPVIDTLLRSVDILRELLQADGNGALSDDAQQLVSRLESFAAGQHAESEVAAPVVKEESEAVDSQLKFYKVEFRPDREMFASGNDPIRLLRNLASLGSVSVCHLNTEDLPGLADLDTTQCYLSWTVELATASPESELREVFEFVEHLAEIRIQLSVDSEPAQPAVVPVVAAPTVTVEHPAKADHAESREPARERRATPRPASGGDSSSIRVAIDKVDRLIDLVGELVIAHVMTAQMVENFEPSNLPKLRAAVASMERNTRELHERVMGIRMLPVGTLFQRYTRTVYDIAQVTGKQIGLETKGVETEIDKSMLELLGDPLTHLIRNAADHGIESPEQRQAAGKPVSGTIILKAFHRSGRIVIEISDDGAGIDTDRVRSKAIERGLISADADLTQDQLRMLIFEPGFSTRSEVSDLSGRGVGMDVVKRNVQQLNGTVSVASEKGQGTTVSVELPLTLAIMEGLLVGISDRTLVLPLLSVIETVPLPVDKIVRVAQKGEVVIIRGESIPLLRLSRFLNLSAEEVEQHDRKLAVIVEVGSKKTGFVVDELLGQQQVVVKSLERNLHRINGLMGATILGDGCVAPIVDVAGIGELDLFSLQLPSKDPKQVQLKSVR